MNKTRQETLKTTIWIILSALIYTITLNIFIYSGQFFPGGFSGTSVLIVRIFETYLDIRIPYGVLYALMNVPPTILVYKYVGKKFTYFSILQYALVSIFSFFIPKIALNYDPILIAIFGGVLGGISSAIALSRNASAGGTDFIAIYAANKLRRPVWNYIWYANIVIISIAGLLFGFEAALYSIIYQYVVTQVIDARHTRFKHMSLYMITDRPDEVTVSIFNTTRHGITRLWGEGAYSKTPKCLLYMVVNAFEVNDVVEAAKLADPKIFISISKTERIIGNYYQKPLE